MKDIGLTWDVDVDVVDVEVLAIALLLMFSAEVLVSAVWKYKDFQCTSKLFWFIGYLPNVRWQLVPLVRPGHRKPRRPNLSVLARGTTRSPWSVERSHGRCTSALTGLQICKYIGADPLTQLSLSVCLCVWTTTFERNDIWPRYLAHLVHLVTISVTFESQENRSKFRVTGWKNSSGPS